MLVYVLGTNFTRKGEKKPSTGKGKKKFLSKFMRCAIDNSGSITCSAGQTPNPESMNPEVSTKFTVCFDLLITDL